MKDTISVVKNLTKSKLINIIEDSILEREKLEFLLKSLNGISWELDLSTEQFTYVSENAQEFLGYKLEEWIDLTSWKKMLHEEDRDWVVKSCIDEMQKGRSHSIEYRMVKENATVIWVLNTVTIGKDESGNPIKLFGFNIDITEKKLAQEKIEKEHRFLQTILNGISDPVMVVSSDYSVDIMNDVVKKQLQGRRFLDPSSPKCYEISHHRDSPCDGIDTPCPLKDVMESKKSTTVLHTHRYGDENDYFVELAASPLFDEKNNCIGIIESARNLTSHIKLRQELEEKTRLLQYEATHDYLTGLPNRALFMDRLEQSIKDANRNRTSLALFFMDLDHFKEINDTLGHHIGDAVLKAVTRKFKATARASDVLSRLAGDEFTVILKDVGNKEDVAKVAQKFVDIFKNPILVDNHMLQLSVSIGISMYEYSNMYAYDSTFQDKILQEADRAMYDAKAKGKSNFQFSS